MNSKEKGITLITLVVTIVVLLILAAISINLVIGENGIIRRAINASKTQVIVNEKEAVSIAYAGCVVEKNGEFDILRERLQQELDGNGEDTIVDDYDGNLRVTFNKTNHMYVVDTSGNVSIEMVTEDTIIATGSMSLDDEYRYVLRASGEINFASMDYWNGGITKFNAESSLANTDIVKIVNCMGFDKNGKAYSFNKTNSGITIKCLSDDSTSSFYGRRMGSVKDTYQGAFVKGSDNKTYKMEKVNNDDGTMDVKLVNLTDDTTSALYYKNITDVYQFDNVYLLDSDGKLYSKGYNFSGELGNGTNDASNNYFCISDVSGSPLNSKKIVKLYGLSARLFAVDENGKVYAWGSNYEGELGVGTTTQSPMPVCITDLTGSELSGKRAENIICFNNCTFVLTTDNKVFGFGANGDGQLGLGNTSRMTKPKCLNNVSGNEFGSAKIVDIQYYVRDVYAIDENGGMYSWGSKTDALGREETNNFVPKCITKISSNALYNKKVKDLFFTCGAVFVIDEDKKIYSFGENCDGASMNGSSTASAIPVCLTDISSHTLYQQKVKNIFDFDNIIMITTEDGNVYYYPNTNYSLQNNIFANTSEMQQVINSKMPKLLTNIEGNPLYNKTIKYIVDDAFITSENELFYVVPSVG